MNPAPTSVAAGITAKAINADWPVKFVAGQTKVGAPWLTGHMVIASMLDVATATRTAVVDRSADHAAEHARDQYGCS